MTKNLDGLFGLYSEAVVAVGGGKIVYYNDAALKIWPDIENKTPGEIFPAVILEQSADSFVGEIDVVGRRATFSAARLDKLRIFSILAADKNDGEVSAAAFTAMSAAMRYYLTVLGASAGVVLPFAESNGGEKLAECAAKINKCYYNILRLTQNMEVLGVGPREIIRESFDLAAICDKVAAIVAQLTEDSGRTVRFEPPGGKIIVYADRPKLEQMLLNLISNSLIRTENGGKITLSVERTGESAIIKLKDTGEGIPDSIKATAWNRYSEPRSFTDVKSGAGFGMAAASRIARLHGGSIFFESRAGEGTTVAVSIPAAGDKDLMINDEMVYYNESELTTGLTGLATFINIDKYKQKYMD